MLQFITDYPAGLTIPQQVKAVIDGGCRWVELYAPGMSEDDMRSIAQEITPVCKEADAFVIMRDHPKLAAEFRFHGIMLGNNDDPRKIREEIGGEAIIGVMADSLDRIMNLRNADIDYFVVDLRDDEKVGENIELVKKARENDVKKPIVAQGEFSVEEMKLLLANGFSGIALSSTIADAADPATATREIIDALY